MSNYKSIKLGTIAMQGILMHLGENTKHPGKTQLVFFADKPSYTNLERLQKSTEIPTGALFDKPYKLTTEDYGKEIHSRYPIRVKTGGRLAYMSFMDAFQKRVNVKHFVRGSHIAGTFIVNYAEDVGDDKKNIMFLYVKEVALLGKSELNFDHLSKFGDPNNVSSEMANILKEFAKKKVEEDSSNDDHHSEEDPGFF